MHPNNDHYYIERALAYRDLGQMENALKDFNKARELNPKNPQYELYKYEKYAEADCSYCGGSGYETFEKQVTVNVYTYNGQKTGQTTSGFEKSKRKCTNKFCNNGKDSGMRYPVGTAIGIRIAQ